ncbi:hypothetical protein BpHYR1_051636 [Brachionus plicatilis]|uniref:Uncharacterized protein n=1 Tax=Brachionus plicatilis TaxID=10195 RepID=A0A3M7S127_BRAPC|nr:hypothetical protein BpHYR1_051636 [Brachionus plicatilis]
MWKTQVHEQIFKKSHDLDNSTSFNLHHIKITHNFTLTKRSINKPISFLIIFQHIPTTSSAIIDNFDADNIKKFKSCDMLLKEENNFTYSNFNRSMVFILKFGKKELLRDRIRASLLSLVEVLVAFVSYSGGTILFKLVFKSPILVLMSIAVKMG